MNFIASVLIAEAGEENAYYVMMYMLQNHDMRALFLPVSCIATIGLPRTAPKEFSDGSADQVPSAPTLSAPAQNLNDLRLLFVEMVYDAVRLLFTVPPAASYIRPVYN